VLVIVWGWLNCWCLVSCDVPLFCQLFLLCVLFFNRNPIMLENEQSESRETFIWNVEGTTFLFPLEYGTMFSLCDFESFFRGMVFCDTHGCHCLILLFIWCIIYMLILILNILKYIEIEIYSLLLSCLCFYWI